MIFKIKLTLHSVFLFLLLSQINCWENLPQIPTGRRSQYLLLDNSGGYKFGYDTGDGHSAKQTGDVHNQVEGHYFYKNTAGQDIDLKYTAGVQGFVPEGSGGLLLTNLANTNRPLSVLQIPTQRVQNSIEEAGNGDASYAFNIDTDTYQRQENSDSKGNIKGFFSYTNEAGKHDLSYNAGEGTGFVATSGTLSQPNGLKSEQNPQQSFQSYQPTSKAYYPATSNIKTGNDGSYTFSYSTGDSSHQQSSDSAGNIQGHYSYNNEAGNNDLSYVAGSNTGFLVTGGNLVPNNQRSLTYFPVSHSTIETTPSVFSTYQNNDDDNESSTSDSSYSFTIDTDEYKRQESADSSGNVRGSYSYKNSAGSHDLTYVAGSKTGFLPLSGSLSAYPKTETSNAYLPPISSSSLDENEDDLSDTGDSSYNFTIDTDNYKRTEISDANGNVRGSFSYKNEAGANDLTYIAGSETGFVATGGSLSDPNVISNQIGTLPYKPNARYGTSQSDESDSSYNFSIDTDEYKRQESSDPIGNVQGSYWYKNSVGNHNLNYVAGSKTGFQTLGGSLHVPPGLNEVQLSSGQASSSNINNVNTDRGVWLAKTLSSYAPNSNYVGSSGKTSDGLTDNISVYSYLPPQQQKVGYILDTKS